MLRPYSDSASARKRARLLRFCGRGRAAASAAHHRHGACPLSADSFRLGPRMRHVTLAFRTLFKTPFVTGIAVLSLALGIGANAAIFSLFDQILLRPLPVPDPDRLVNLEAPGLKPGSQSCGQAGDCDVVFTYPMFRDLERTQTVFTGLAAHLAFGVSLSYRDQSTTGEGMYVSGSYFPTLGLRPALGRLLGPADDQGIGTNYVTVLGYRYWQSHFGSDPGVLGRPLLVNGQAMTIAGVAPQDFQGTTLGVRPLVFVPISMRGVLEPGFRGFENRRSYWAYLFGRLKPRVSLAQARAGLNAVYHPIVTDVEAPLQNGISDQMMAEFRVKRVVLTPGRRGQSSMHRDAQTPLLMLFSVTAIVLLIACANIANLLLARGAGRSMEMGVRLALGARRGQLVTQLLTESVLLASLGALAGLIVANWTLAGIATLAPPEVAVTLGFGLRPVVLVFAAALALATGIVFGVFLAGYTWGSDVYVQGFPSGPDVEKNARFNAVGAGHFATLGVRLRAGREFTPADRRGAPRVAVVNQAFVNKFNLGQGAVGKFMSIGPGPLNIQIVGVIPDVKYSDVKQAVPPLVYTPWRQDTHVGTMNFYVRSPQSEALLRPLPTVLKQIYPGLPMNGLMT